MRDTLNERLIGKKVYVERSLHSSTGNGSQTILYWGTYAGVDLLGTLDVLVLENAEHFNCAEVYFNKDIPEKKTRRICSKREYIPLNQLLSLSEDCSFDKQ